MELTMFAPLRPNDTDLPAYAHVRDELRRLIDSGALRAGHRLPTERALAELLDVSRITVRHATSALEGEGLLIRRHGSGTYVAPPRVPTDSLTLTGFSSVLQRRGRTWQTEVLSVGHATPGAAVVAALRLTDAEQVVRLVRVRTIDGIPSSLETSWLPGRTAERLLDEPLGASSLFDTLRAAGNFEPDHATERLSAVVLEPTLARHLDSRDHAPAFDLERTTFSAGGTPLEFAQTLLRADRFTFVSELPTSGRPVGSLLDVAGPS